MNWKPGLILRIADYRFEDDQSTRDKYSIILFADDAQVYVIHSLTTSQSRHILPGQPYGCSKQGGISYFHIPAGQIIGNQGFSFEKETYIFFNNNVRKEQVAKFDAAAKRPLGLVELGTLSNEELKRIIKCALKSDSIPVAIAKELAAFKATLS